MTSEPKEFVRAYRQGRMRGVMIPIDADTWEYCLKHAGIPLDTPLETIKIRRYATKGNRIIIKILVEGPITPPVSTGGVDTAARPDAAETQGNSVLVSKTPIDERIDKVVEEMNTAAEKAGMKKMKTGFLGGD